MTMIREIPDRSACAAWCPVASHPDLVVLGSKDSGGLGFEDTGGELEVYDLNLSGRATATSTPSLVASTKTVARFSSVCWGVYSGSNDQYPLGLIAGGMTDGTIHIWDAAALLDPKNAAKALLYTMDDYCRMDNIGPVSALSFHPLEPWQLATGSVNGQVLVIDLSGQNGPVATSPCGSSNKQHSAEVTAVAWNSQVAHILASSSRDGTVGVWDLKQRKVWCTLQVEHGAVVDVAWNPKEGLYLLTASGDDRNPVLKVWDLRASTSMPLTTMTGHAAGLLKTSWCPHDDALLLSCGKDNRTLLWDLVRMQAVTELPTDSTCSDGISSGLSFANQQQQQQNQNQQPTPNQLFASSSSLTGQKHMRVFCEWSPLKRGLALTASLDRKVQIHSILSLATQSGRPPKWMRPLSAVSTGFGGTIVSVNSHNKIATIRTIQEQPVLAATAAAFETELASTHPIVFCETRRTKCKVGSSEEKMWGFMRVIFEPNAREQLLEHLGFDANHIALLAASQQQDNKADDDDTTAVAANGVASVSLHDGAAKPMSQAAQEVVKKALVVGNFEAAVECCFQAGNLADALLLSYCGGGDLWSKTQERYFEKESAKRPYLSLLQGIARSKLEDLVESSDTKQWQETLAILSSYGQSDEFPPLCVALGHLLESVGDAEHASLCYMCALNAENAAKFWVSEFEADNENIMALHDLIVKVTVFMGAAGAEAEIPPNIAELFFKYAEAVAEQGLFVIAAKYCKGSSVESMILRDRLYRSRDSQRCLAELGSAPDFPFASVAVSQSRASVSTHSSTTRSSAVQQQQQQQAQSRGSYASQQQQSQVAYGSQQPARRPSTSSQYNQQSQAPVSDQLPPDWTALQDPSSGRTYYANQATGESSWDRPAAPKPSTQPAYPSTPTPANDIDNATTTSQTSSASKRSTKAALVSRYGDGFVTSSSHPELAGRYGNVGTSNPYTVTRPGIAASAAAGPQGATTQAAPSSGPIDIHAVDLSAQHESIKANFLALYDYLESICSHSEKRQLDEGKKGIDALVKKLSRNGLDEETEANVMAMVNAISNHDFRTATSIVTDLVSHEWKHHKDWLKGIKLLLQLASKKVSL